MIRLPESELDIMLALWEEKQEPVPRSYFDKKLSHKNWNVNTLNSFLVRLEDKGFISSTRAGKNKYYSAIIAQENYLAQEGKSILHKLYSGSVKKFLLSITEQDGLKEEEINELQQFLNELNEGGRNDS